MRIPNLDVLKYNPANGLISFAFALLFIQNDAATFLPIRPFDHDAMKYVLSVNSESLKLMMALKPPTKLNMPNLFVFILSRAPSTRLFCNAFQMAIRPILN